jgi:hypothetical protein
MCDATKTPLTSEEVVRGDPRIAIHSSRNRSNMVKGARRRFPDSKGVEEVKVAGLDIGFFSYETLAWRWPGRPEVAAPLFG